MDSESKPFTVPSPVDQRMSPEEEEEQARRLAKRYRCDFVDLKNFPIDPELFRNIPAEWMFR